MNRLSKQKKNEIILAVVMTLGVLSGLYFWLIKAQRSGLHAVEKEHAKLEADLNQIRTMISNSDQIEADLLVVSNRLAASEETMASGDLYASMVGSIRQFKGPYKVEIPQFSPGGPAAEATLMPKFPYKQFTTTVSGSAYYFDLGRFIADFENAFPCSRIVNVELSPASASKPDDKDKLLFTMNIISLVAPGGIAVPAKK